MKQSLLKYLFILLSINLSAQNISRFAFNPTFFTNTNIDFSIGAITAKSFSIENYKITSDFIQPQIYCNKKNKYSDTILNQNKIKIYPNPFTDKININIKSKKNFSDLIIELTDLQGRKILSLNKELPDKTIYTNISINTETLKNNLYFLRIYIDGKTQLITKIIKQ